MAVAEVAGDESTEVKISRANNMDVRPVSFRKPAFMDTFPRAVLTS